ncbi:adenosine deaminase [Subtercola frigoramans]|uniref:Adenine deaminase n=1 Tax=Subtercola frigoramans TaxID=120298 RepID=A0ABS2L395_9MICO|nr:adenosine deaminase [Subtercola frigoramans]MBM7471550.1 adenosine deaminase [Subtercola frigoramans]
MSNTSTVTPEFLVGLPKCELHLHLEGTLEPELKLALARRNGVDIGQNTVEEVRATYQFDSLASFLAVYYPAMEVLVEEQDFYDLAAAYFVRAAADGVRRVEAFFDPQAHTSRGVPIANVILGYSRAARDAAELGVSAALILCFLRDFSAESALETLREALPFKEHLIGVGLDSDERENPPVKFQPVFELARAEGLKLTMHCDIDQLGSIENIRQVLEDIGVDRIDHGTNIVESPALVAFAIERGVGFTTCPVSNSFVTADMKADEIVQLLRQGALVCVNSDDPAYFGAYIAKNYVALVEKADLSLDDVVALARNSFDASWLSDEDKAVYRAEIDAYVERFVNV